MYLLRTTIFSAAIMLSLGTLPMPVAHGAPAAPAVQPAAGDVSGTYTWSQGGGGGGGGGGETTLVLKQEGNKLTGTISGRNGDTQIEDGTVEGGTIKFKVTREFNGNKMVTQYSGTVSGSDLKLTQTTTRDIDAKKKA